jgi:outer membrane protein
MEVVMGRVGLIMAAALLLVSNSAMADSIAGKLGVSVRGGFTVPADNKLEVSGLKIETDTGWNVGGGLTYGINDAIAANLDVIYFQSGGKVMGVDVGTGKTTDISLGVQYRFIPRNVLVPYVGAGIDVLINNFSADSNLGAPSALDVDTTFGGHLSVGIDYFIARNVALNAEFRGVLSTEGDVKDDTGFVGAKYDPSNFSGLFGIRYFF